MEFLVLCSFLISLPSSPFSSPLSLSSCFTSFLFFPFPFSLVFSSFSWLFFLRYLLYSRKSPSPSFLFIVVSLSFLSSFYHFTLFYLLSFIFPHSFITTFFLSFFSLFYQQFFLSFHFFSSSFLSYFSLISLVLFFLDHLYPYRFPFIVPFFFIIVFFSSLHYFSSFPSLSFTLSLSFFSFIITSFVSFLFTDNFTEQPFI